MDVTARLIGISIAAALLSAPAAALATDLVVGGEKIEIVDAKGRASPFTLARPAAPVRITVEGPGTLKVHARQLVDKKNPLTRVPVTITISIDGKDQKTLKIQDKAQIDVQVRGEETLNPTPARMVDLKVPAGTHEILVKVSSTAVRGAATRFEYDGAAAPAPPVVAIVPVPAPGPAPAPPLEPIAKKPEPPPAPPLVPIAKREPAPAPAPAPLPPLEPIAKKTEPPPVAAAEPKPAPAPVPAAPAAPPPAAPKKPSQSEVDRAAEALGLKPKPPQKTEEASVTKTAQPAAKRTWNMVEFTPRVGILFPLQMGNPAPVGGLNIYYYPLRYLGVGVEGEYYTYTRDFKVASGLTGDQGASYRLTVIPATLDVRYEPYRTRGFAPFGGAGLGLWNVKAETKNDWGGRQERSSNAFGWQVFGGVNGKIGFGQICFDLSYSWARDSTANARNVNAGGVTVGAGYQMGF